MALADLKPHPKNPRRFPEPGSAEWESLRRSLAADYFDPIVVNSGKTHKALKNVLVSGHLRVKVLIADGYTHADAVVKDYDEARHVQVMLRANNQTGEWDETMLAELLKDIPEPDLDLTGLDLRKIDRLIKSLTKGAFAGTGESEDGDPKPQAPVQRQRPNELLAIMLTREEFRKWTEHKQAVDIGDDAKALMALITEEPT